MVQLSETGSGESFPLKLEGDGVPFFISASASSRRDQHAFPLWTRFAEMPRPGREKFEMVPSSPDVSLRMAKVRSRDTDAEMALRRALFGQGLRFRVNRHPSPEVRSRADVVFGPSKVAVYVDGCFWHSCPKHATTPRTNRDWWEDKLRRNRDRDREVSQALTERGWKVIRVWEHEDPFIAASRVARAVRQRRGESPDER
jgi:DNA mismatch endonuclease (patch repair protein)